MKPNLSLVSVKWWTSARNLPANGQVLPADWITAPKHHRRVGGYCTPRLPSAGPWSGSLHGRCSTLQDKVACSNQPFFEGTSAPWRSGELAPSSRCLGHRMRHYGKGALWQSLTLWSRFPKDRTKSGTKRLQPKVKRMPLCDYQTGSVPVAGRRTLDSMLDAHACLDPVPAHALWIPCVPAFLKILRAS